MRGRTITLTVVDKRGKAAKTIPLYQYDYGQKLLIDGVELPEYYEVHFSNQQHGESVTVLGDSTGVLIPDEMVATGENIYVWLFLHDTSYDGETEYFGVIPVIKRAQPTDITPTPEEQSIITEVIAALNNMEDDMSEQVQAAEAAKEAAQTAQTAAEGAATTASGYVDAVTAAQAAAEAAQAAAETAATSATASATSAASSANSANNALAEATNAKIAAVDAANSASTSATSASTASGNAANSAVSAESARVDAAAAKVAAEAAQTAAETAQGKAEDAQGSAEADALIAEGYAVGKQDGEDVASGSTYYHNNAKYYADAASDSATAAAGSEDNAEDSAEDAEAYAVGTRGGVDVESGDPAYENNAKYYAEEAATVLEDKLDAPATAGTAGQVLTSDGDGGQAWADPSGAIDDTAGEGDTDVTWSADKLNDELTDVLNAIQGVGANLNKVIADGINLFDKTVSTESGYDSPSGKLNSVTLIPEKDSRLNGHYLSMKAIKIKPNTTYAFPKDFNGRLTVYNATKTTIEGVDYYNRSVYVSPSGMTNGNNCLLWTSLGSHTYIVVSIYVTGGVTQDYINNFMIIEVENPSTFVFPDFIATHDKIVPVSSIGDYNVKGQDEKALNGLASKADKRVINLYDNTVEIIEGKIIGTTADTTNLVPTNLENYAAFDTANVLIPVRPSSKIAVPLNFYGVVGIYNALGNRQQIVEQNNMTKGKNCLYLSTLSNTKYAAVSFNKTQRTDYNDDFILAVGLTELPETFIPYGRTFLTDSQVLIGDVVGLPEYNKDQNSKFTFAEDEDNESYASRVQETQGANVLTITFKTDSHTDMNLNTTLKKTQVKAAMMPGYVGDYLGQDVIIHGGDFLTFGYDSNVIPLHSLRSYLNRLYKFAKAPLLIAKGNHDDACFDTQFTVGNYDVDKLILPNQWNAIAMQFAKKYAVCNTKGNANYCYFDNERTKIRVFVLDSEDFDYKVVDGVATYTSGVMCAFSNEQLNFVANALMFADKEDPSEWAAIFVSHRPMDVTTQSRKRFGMGDILIRNHDVMLNIIKAYQNGTAYADSGYGGESQAEIDSHDFPYDVDIDYTSKGAGEVICFLSGHTHTCNTSDEVGLNSSSLSYGFRYVGCSHSGYYTLTFNRDTKKINVYFSGSDKDVEPLENPEAATGAIVGLTVSDLNEYGDWETSWT